MNVKEAIQKEYFNILNDFSLEVIDQVLRYKFTEYLNLFMNYLHFKRQICEFRVVCDETNNLPEDVEDGYINVYVFYKELPYDFEYKKVILGNPRLLK